MDFSLLNKVPIDKEIYILQIFNELTEIMGNEGYIHANSIIVGDNSILSISTFRQPGESGEKDSACDRLFSTRFNTFFDRTDQSDECLRGTGGRDPRYRAIRWLLFSFCGW